MVCLGLAPVGLLRKTDFYGLCLPEIRQTLSVFEEVTTAGITGDVCFGLFPAVLVRILAVKLPAVLPLAIPLTALFSLVDNYVISL